MARPDNDHPYEDTEQRRARDEAVVAKEAEPVGEIPPGPRPNTDEFVTPRLGPQPTP